ncbi:hypothetical protein LOAG_17385 [Loa loa]|uniref:Uncharacterized protein n=1 Tax=Loa loa TaxID=7209 RepID=A0A1S0UIS0_LOALO|nr:hypothetical protein LOAG_17385 [Loa loa]EJD75475.1 hypothetical protein LOAG_17385 [Loa loa]
MGLAGMIAAGTVATSAVAVTAVCVPFVTPALRKICIPYVPATPQQLQNVATALSVCPTKVSPLVDLGSGDGRVVLQCARAGYLSVGLELNIPLILYSRWRARRECLSHLTKFYRKDIFKADLKQYKAAIIFGTETLMSDLSMKIVEMKIGSFLIACRFPLPPSEGNTQWLLLSTVGSGFDSVWLYEKIC